MYNKFEFNESWSRNMKFVVINGRIITPGSHSGLRYIIFDVIDLDPSKDIENQKRKYAWRKFYSHDGKRLVHIKENIGARQRDLTTHVGRHIETITIFDDYISGTFYGFIPVESFFGVN
jgi:hypothetical protein